MIVSIAKIVLLYAGLGMVAYIASCCLSISTGLRDKREGRYHEFFGKEVMNQLKKEFNDNKFLRFMTSLCGKHVMAAMMIAWPIYGPISAYTVLRAIELENQLYRKKGA